MKIETSHKRLSTTILISMTDVIFLLLIFLMLSSNFITQTGINVKLPGSSSGVQHQLKSIEVVYTKFDQFIINGIQMDEDQFRSMLPNYFQSEDQVIRLVADKDVNLQSLITVMDIIRQTGFEKITIATYKVTEKTDEGN